MTYQRFVVGFYCVAAIALPDQFAQLKPDKEAVSKKEGKKQRHASEAEVRSLIHSLTHQRGVDKGSGRVIQDTCNPSLLRFPSAAG